MHQHKGKNVRIRYTAAGALAALAAVGAIAGTGALAAKPSAGTPRHAAVAKGSATKTPTQPGASKVRAPQPGSDQPFLNAVQRLVSDGTISAAEGQVLDREIAAGSLNSQTLTGFSQSQLQAVEQTLQSTKQALAPRVARAPK